MALLVVCPCLMLATCMNLGRNIRSGSSYQPAVATSSPSEPPGLSESDTDEPPMSIEDSGDGTSVTDSGDYPSSPDSAYPGEHFPETRQRKLTAGEVEVWEFKKVRYAINELFARKGAEFKTDFIRKQFESMSWYQPIPGRNPQSMLGLLSSIEKHNLKLLGTRRKELEKLGLAK